MKKRTLLNLGSDFNVEQEDWATLSKRVDEIIKRAPSLFTLDKDLETIAQHYALKIIGYIFLPLKYSNLFGFGLIS
ncbi:MAG: hypothetical protein Q9M40_05065 [Sulfurimonas sp.]|nr:hypothetical protein [Sulfurimonas sp.]